MIHSDISLLQSRLASGIEAVAQVAVGFVLSLVVWEYAVRPAIHADLLSVDSSLVITLIFTIVSLVRQYAIRRFYVWRAA